MQRATLHKAQRGKGEVRLASVAPPVRKRKWPGATIKNGSKAARAIAASTVAFRARTLIPEREHRKRILKKCDGHAPPLVASVRLQILALVSRGPVLGIPRPLFRVCSFSASVWPPMTAFAERCICLDLTINALQVAATSKFRSTREQDPAAQIRRSSSVEGGSSRCPIVE